MIIHTWKSDTNLTSEETKTKKQKKEEAKKQKSRLFERKKVKIRGRTLIEDMDA